MSLSWLAIVFTCLGVAWAAWWLLHDRSRGRARCPKCWYALHVTENEPLPRCPECGREITHPAQVYRTRRHWKRAALGLLMLLPAWGAWKYQRFQTYGWSAYVPDALLVTFWPWSEQAWMIGGVDPTVEHLQERLNSQAIGTWEASWLAARVTKALTRELPQSSTWSMDMTRLIERESRERLGWDEVRQMVSELLSSTVQPEEWLNNGGMNASARWAGDILVIHAPPAMRDSIDRMLKDLERMVLSTPSAEGTTMRTNCFSLVRDDGTRMQVGLFDTRAIIERFEAARPHRRDGANQLQEMVAKLVQPESWEWAGGDVGAMHEFCGLLLFQHSPEVLDEIERIFGFIDACQRGSGAEWLAHDRTRPRKPEAINACELVDVSDIVKRARTGDADVRVAWQRVLKSFDDIDANSWGGIVEFEGALVVTPGVVTREWLMQQLDEVRNVAP